MTTGPSSDALSDHILSNCVQVTSPRRMLGESVTVAS